MSDNNIEEMYGTQFMWAEPVEYKGVVLNPVTCRDMQKFYSSVNCLLYDTLRYNTMVSTLPRLYFITDLINHVDDQNYILENKLLYEMFICLQTILKIVLGNNQEFNFVESKGKWYLQIRRYISDSKNSIIDIKAKDFNIIREIILHQNGVDYDDTFVHEDIRKWIEEHESNSKSPPATIEDYIQAFMIQMKLYKLEEIKNIPLRYFHKIIEKSLLRENYNLQMTASMSGLVSFKGTINHWITINNKNKIFEKYFKEI